MCWGSTHHVAGPYKELVPHSTGNSIALQMLLGCNSHGPSPLVMVHKADGSWCLAVSARRQGDHPWIRATTLYKWILSTNSWPKVPVVGYVALSLKLNFCMQVVVSTYYMNHSVVLHPRPLTSMGMLTQASITHVSVRAQKASFRIQIRLSRPPRAPRPSNNIIQPIIFFTAFFHSISLHRRTACVSHQEDQCILYGLIRSMHISCIYRRSMCIL